MLLLISGLIPALIFLAQHRPSQWKRAAAWDASGLVIVVALWYVRSIILIVLRWPGHPPTSLLDALISVVLLAVIDSLLILRLMSYRAFAQRDKNYSVEKETEVVPRTEGGSRPLTEHDL
jgi:hypothetical protein